MDFVELYQKTQTIGWIITIISTIICPIIADKKKRSIVGWIFGGLLLGLIGVIIISCLKEKEK